MSDLICTIEQGQLKGKYEIDIDGTPFLGFMGIPYAKAPLGNLRFKAPQPPEKWEGIRDATKEGSVCYCLQTQIKREVSLLYVTIFSYSTIFLKGLKREVTGSEDCLFLNVFTREIQTTKLKPVMVFIHGGAFRSGSSERTVYGPEFLMIEDIVLVTLNYRLGALGFLVIEDAKLEVTGNTGLKDQVQALNWIQQNIKHFGGDPSNVTVFGQSAGAASAHYLLLSPLTKGLFHKAILQSGVALCHWTRGVNDACKLAQTMGCKETDNTKILEFLQKMPVEKLLNAQYQMQPMMISPSSKISFGPTMEVPWEHALLCEEPTKLMASGTYNHVPLIMGYTSMEGILPVYTGEAIEVKNDNFQDVVPYYFGLSKNGQEFMEMNKKIIQFYSGKDKLEVDDKVTISKLFTGIAFVKDIQRAAKMFAKSCQKPIYFYRMSIETDLNFFKKILQANIDGVCHSDDLGYLFKNETTILNPGTIEDWAARRFVKLWANFARTGNPIPEKNPLLNAEWQPVDDSKIHFLDIGTDLVPGVDPDIEEMNFWEEISQGVTEFY